jgi:hypothetical protein
MDKAKQLEAEFSPKGVLDAGILLLQPNDAIDLVRRCRDQLVPILGIDAFRLGPARTQPILEDSIDFSSASVSLEGPNAWRRAELFLQDRLRKDLFFEIVMGSGPTP